MYIRHSRENSWFFKNNGRRGMPKISSNQNALFSFIAKLEVVKTTSSFTGKNHEFHDLHSIIERDGPRFHEFHRIIDRTINRKYIFVVHIVSLV